MLLKVYGEWFEVLGDYSEAEPEVGCSEDFTVEEVKFKGLSLPFEILDESFLDACSASAIEAINAGPDPDEERMRLDDDMEVA